MASENTEFIGARIPRGMMEALERRAKMLDRTVSWVMRDCIRRQLHIRKK